MPFGPQTGARDRPVPAVRRAHRLADTPALWLGDRGKAFSYDGLYMALRYRAELAGIAGFHPHVLRHTAAQRWLSPQGLRGRTDGRGRLDPPRHVRPLHPRHGLRPGRRRGPRLNLGDL